MQIRVKKVMTIYTHEQWKRNTHILLQHLKEKFNILSQKISCDFMNNKDRDDIDIISFKVKRPNI